MLSWPADPIPIYIDQCRFRVNKIDAFSNKYGSVSNIIPCKTANATYKHTENTENKQRWREWQIQTLSVHGFAAELALILIYKTNSCCLVNVSTYGTTLNIILLLMASSAIMSANCRKQTPVRQGHWWSAKCEKCDWSQCRNDPQQLMVGHRDMVRVRVCTYFYIPTNQRFLQPVSQISIRTFAFRISQITHARTSVVEW